MTETVRVIAEARGMALEALIARLDANFQAFIGRRRVDTPAKAVV